MYGMLVCFFFFFKQKTAYEMRISDWSSDVCSSDLCRAGRRRRAVGHGAISSHGAISNGEADAERARGAGGEVEGCRASDDGRARRRVVEQIGRASGRERVCQYV